MSRSLAGVLRRWMVVFAALAVVIFAVASTVLFYQESENAAQEALLDQAQSYARVLNEQNLAQAIPHLEDQISGRVRITLVDARGQVLYDSQADAATLANHADRPEIIEAAANGTGVSGRASETLQQDMLYAAVGLSDGSFIRLSEQRESLLAFLEKAALPLLGIFVVLAALAVPTSRALSKKIMEPVNSLEISQPMKDPAYREMAPLFARINQQQAELLAKNQELARADALRRDFTSNVSHDMKTPLHVILGYAELMKAGQIPESHMRKFSEVIYAEAQRLSRLVDDVLTLSQLDSSNVDTIQKAEVDLSAVVKTVVERLDPVAEGAGVGMNCTCPAHPIRLMGNQKLLDELVYNLVDNAIRYTEPGGHVAVQIASAGREAVLTVSDTGCGIPKADHERVFGRFVRLDKSRRADTGGTGLGLAIVKHVVQVHGGTVGLTSTVGQGSTFTVTLPIARLESELLRQKTLGGA